MAGGVTGYLKLGRQLIMRRAFYSAKNRAIAQTAQPQVTPLDGVALVLHTISAQE